jgi:hypothetical protein
MSVLNVFMLRRRNSVLHSNHATDQIKNNVNVIAGRSIGPAQ